MYYLRLLLALLAGTTVTAALAPFNYLWLAPLAPLLLFLLLDNAPLKQAPMLGWCFGLGFFGSGISWVFVSISEHSETPLPIAVALTALFVMALALLFLLQAWLWKRWFSGTLGAFSFIGVWVLAEWMRSWLLTGFPWLYLGYAAIDTPLAAWSPIGGVWLNSLIFASAGILLIRLIKRQTASLRMISLSLLILPWAGLPFIENSWTTLSGAPLNVTLIQANIPQAEKWVSTQRPAILTQYEAMTRPHLDSDLIVWPETAIPTFFSRAAATLNPLLETLDDTGTTLISGLPTFTQNSNTGQRQFHNSLAILSGGSGVYHKQRLVPFGEYIPLEKHLRGTLEFFNLPMSSFSLPNKEQSLLKVKGYEVAAAICYEIAYPELVRKSSLNADFILTVSNDTWFGHSIAPAQHMQIAQMRALETARWIIRATNNGISGLINPQGRIVMVAPRYQQATLTGTIEPREGLTPFQRFGSWPILAFALLLCVPALLRRPQSSFLSGSALQVHPND